MKRSLILLALALGAAACDSSAPVAFSNTAATPPARDEKLETSIAHSTESETPVTANENKGPATGKWSQSGNPIDTAKFDGVIAEAEKALKAKPNDPEVKNALSEAYYDRGFALTDARQYAAALGDYRRALKYNPDNEDAKQWVDQIIMIYGQLKKDYPKEGEEPPPLPFKKETGNK